MRKTPLKRVSKKLQTKLPEYYKLVGKLRELCDNKSELSSNKPDWMSNYLVEPHHINGRTGKRLLDPFNIIMLRRDEHDIEEGKIPGTNLFPKVGKEKLTQIVYDIRIKQGFLKEELGIK